MGIEPTSEAWEDAGESFMPQLERKTLSANGSNRPRTGAAHKPYTHQVIVLK
jgi:hypothetical protein